ncbi:MAG: SUMF1/EgtB/PvdO family nonheme iron enzyme [Chloroflexaceae bacterium]|nr:SUMF1/EgtB/PvdO family nonheme iron enzyme [Chloroflexaceae bacterium]
MIARTGPGRTQLSPLPYWCKVPGGSYLIGGWERGERSARLRIKTFWIARVPLTRAQFEPFVAEGYRRDARRWWTTHGWDWKQEVERTQPWYWDDERFQQPQQPVVGLSWYEAVAFCHWLNDRLALPLPLGYTVRLPTEAEWEVAAAYGRPGSQRRTYPWGNRPEPDADHAVFDRSWGDLPLVGTCPLGAAWCGALDMAGTVWEWCCNSYENYPGRSYSVISDVKRGDYDAYPTLRGGSYWSTNVPCGARSRVPRRQRHPRQRFPSGARPSSLILYSVSLFLHSYAHDSHTTHSRVRRSGGSGGQCPPARPAIRILEHMFLFFKEEPMPKTFRHLWSTFSSFDNLWRAYLAARRGKRRRPAVAAYELAAESHLFALQERLNSATWQPGGYRTFVIREWKRRLVSAAPFEDRIVHHALCQVLEPLWEARFIADSYACRKGKGTLAALNRAQYFARRYSYVLQLDVREFFPSIDHDILLTTLQRHLADARLLAVCSQIIASGRDILAEAYTPVLFPGDDLLALARPRGLPIGNLTSQFWANVYLHPLDLCIKQELHSRGYVRYCDDLLLFADDKATLHHWQAAIVARLADLRLTIHSQRARIAPVSSGIPFVGWTITPERRRLRRRNVVRFRRRYRQRLIDYAEGRISYAQLLASVHGWVGHARQGSTHGLRRAILSQPVPRPQHG